MRLHYLREAFILQKLSAYLLCLIIGAYHFYFYSHEPNEPPHIHINRDDFSAKFWLEPVALTKNIGFRPKELIKLESLVQEHNIKLLESWYGYFGN